MNVIRERTSIIFSEKEMDSLKIACSALNELYGTLSGDELVSFEEAYDVSLGDLNEALLNFTRLAVLHDYKFDL